MHMLAGALPVPFLSKEVSMLFALRMVMLATLLGMYRLSPVLGIAALSIGAGFIVGQRLQRATAR
jgi:hypothetical protein